MNLRLHNDNNNIIAIGIITVLIKWDNKGSQ